MKKMTVQLLCDGTPTCTRPVTDENVVLALGSQSVLVDLCDDHYAEISVFLGNALSNGIPTEKKKRKSPTKKTVSTTTSKSAETSTASEAAEDRTTDTPALDELKKMLDKSRACTYCGEVKRSNAGLAQHVRHKHGKTLAQHNAAEAKKTKVA